MTVTGAGVTPQIDSPAAADHHDCHRPQAPTALVCQPSPRRSLSDSSYFKYFKPELGIPTGDRLGVTVTGSAAGATDGLTAESVSVMDREPAGRAKGRAGRRETFHHNERVRVSKDPGLPGSLLTDGAGPGGLPTRSQSLSKMLR